MNPSRPARLVAATGHNPDLEFLRPAARAAVRLMQQHGRPPAVVLFDSDATRPELLLQTRGHGRRYDFAFVCCEGDAGQLFNELGEDPPRVPLLDPADRVWFHDAVLLLCCPAWHVTLATSLIGSPAVRAVIGYDRNLVVPPDLRYSGWAGVVHPEVEDGELNCVPSEFADALLAPLASLLVNPDVATAVQAGRDAWRDLANRLGAACGIRTWPFAFVAAFNAQALRSW
ncbi:MAG: hypothetical protein ACRC33_05640 [Gemmataceae bacterium]